MFQDRGIISTIAVPDLMRYRSMIPPELMSQQSPHTFLTDTHSLSFMKS